MDIPFRLLRLLLFFWTFVLVSAWLMLPTKLDLQQARESTPVASRVELKSVTYVILSGASHAEVRIRCSDAPALCRAPVPARGAVVRVWLQHVGLAGHWVVAADYNGRPVASVESQNSLYRIEKLFWGLGAALAQVPYLSLKPTPAAETKYAAIVVDAKEEYAAEYCMPALAANALYEQAAAREAVDALERLEVELARAELED